MLNVRFGSQAGVTTASCPFLPTKQTFVSTSDMSAMCHNEIGQHQFGKVGLGLPMAPPLRPEAGISCVAEQFFSCP